MKVSKALSTMESPHPITKSEITKPPVDMNTADGQNIRDPQAKTNSSVIMVTLKPNFLSIN
jgi:hypothetical protein